MPNGCVRSCRSLESPGIVELRGLERYRCPGLLGRRSAFRTNGTGLDSQSREGEPQTVESTVTVEVVLRFPHAPERPPASLEFLLALQIRRSLRGGGRERITVAFDGEARGLPRDDERDTPIVHFDTGIDVEATLDEVVEQLLFQQRLERGFPDLARDVLGHRIGGSRRDRRDVAEQRVTQVCSFEAIDGDRMEQPQLILRPRRGHVEPTLVLVRGQGGEVLIRCYHHRQEHDVALVALEVRWRAHSQAALFPLLDADTFDQLVANLVDLRLPLQHNDSEGQVVVRGIGEALGYLLRDGNGLGPVDERGVLSGDRRPANVRVPKRRQAIGTELPHRHQWRVSVELLTRPIDDLRHRTEVLS